jgi:hypothetical protein
LRHQNEQNTKVKVVKEGKSVLDWYAINVSPDQNFSHIFEAISQASTHALNVSLFKEPVRLDDFKDGRIFIVQDISEDKNKIESGWSLSVADCVKKFGFNHILFDMVSKTFQTLKCYLSSKYKYLF